MEGATISNRLIFAVREGRIETVRQLLASYSLSYSSAWSDGYILLRDALKCNQTEVTQLLLTYGPKVNSKSIKPTATPLHFAARNGDIEIVHKLIARAANISALDSVGRTPLHYAVESKKMKIVELLLDLGASINGCKVNVITPLRLAAQNMSIEIVELLLRRHADIDVNGKGGTPLHMAIRLGNLQIVELFLKCGANVNSTCSSRYEEGTPLQFAVECGNKEVAKLLLESGANVDAQDRNGKTILYFAVRNGRQEVVKLLLESGANVDAQDKDGKTILYFAVKEGRQEVVKLLLERGANVDAQDKDGKTILYLAIENGHSEIIEDILKRCPDVNSKTNRNALSVVVQRNGTQYKDIIENLLQYGFTLNPEDANDSKLLHAAVEKGYLTIVEQLIKYGTDVNILYNLTSGKGCMPLHTATRNKQEEVAELLISYGADVNAQDTTGNTPIFYATENTDLKMTKLLLTNKANVKDYPELLNTAVEKNCTEIIELLLQHGADVNASDKYGMKALHFTAINKHEGISAHKLISDKDSDNVKGEIAKMLLSRGANVNAEVENGGTTLHAAICKGYVKVVEALLEYNADVNFTCSNDRTPLSYAAEKGNEVITKMLLNKGADIYAKDEDGRTALHIATAKHHKQVVEVLLKCGASVDAKTTKGTTPLHMAALNNNSDIVRLLVTFGADIDSKNEFGMTALHTASKEGKTQIVRSLLDHGSDVTIMCKDGYTALDLAEAGNKCSFYSERYSYQGSYWGKSDVYNDYDYYDRLHHSIIAYAEIAKLLKLHIVKLRTANLYAKNQHLLPIISDKKFNSVRNACEEEIICMKCEQVGNTNITFHNILTKGISQLAIYAGNESVVQVLRSNEYEIKFPIYASTINTHFRNGERRKELLEEGNQIFNSFFSFLGLPHVCTERIFNYLSDADLRTLMDAYKPVSINNPDIDINNVIITSNISKISYA